MSITTYTPNITLLAEQTLVAYISSSLSGSNLTDNATQYYCGVANGDVTGPAVLVTCNTADEVVFQSRVYRINCDISTRMIAYDSGTTANVTNSSISLSGNVFSLFGDTNKTCPAINTLQTGLAAIQIQVKSFQNERAEDAWISNQNVDMICTLVNS